MILFLAVLVGVAVAIGALRDAATGSERALRAVGYGVTALLVAGLFVTLKSALF